ncbi:exported hypothetical protein [metagenome]|uniref:GP-PDE domain-containing protein n=1 Tax=metagenome TaxID=256318 RepID=A0A2P2CD40_9ZZZZ
MGNRVGANDLCGRRARWGRLTGGVVGLLLAVGMLAPPAHAEAVSPPCSALVAHRGGAAYPGVTEGSLGAIRRSVDDLGVRAFEVDIRTTASDTIYVMHDDTVDRTTSGTGAVADMTSAEMGSLRLDDGQRIPTLANIITLVHARPDVHVVLHVKSMTKRSWKRMTQRIRTYGVQSQVTLMGRQGTVTRAHATFRRVDTVLLSPTPIVAEVGAADAVAIPQSLVTPENVAANHANALDYWTFSPASEQWSSLAGAGVDIMLINDVEAYLAVCTP